MKSSSLFRKYAMPLILLSSGAVVVSGMDQMYFSYEDSKSALGRVQHERAVAASIRIEQFVRDVEHQLAWIAQAPWGTHGVPLDRRRLDSLRLLRNVPAITEVSHIDPEGREQLKVSRLAMDVIGGGGDYSRDPKFSDARRSGTYFSPVYFRKDSEPYMTIALAGSGENAGVVAAEANLKFIWNVVADMKVGEGGHAYVLDASGRLIAHPDISLVLRNTDMSGLSIVRAAIARGRMGLASDEALTGEDAQGREVLSTSAPIAPLGWTVFVDLPLKEAFAPLYASLLRTGILLLAGLAVSVIASLVLVRRMVEPIRTLQAGAAKIGAGALGERIEVKTGDELQALGEEFNHMAGQLQESYAGLERKVDERTRDLTEALERQTATAEILQVISSSVANAQPVFEKITQSCQRLFKGSQIGISLVRSDGMIELVAYMGPDETKLRQMYPFPVGEDSGTGLAMRERRPLHYPDALHGEGVPPYVRRGAEYIGGRSTIFAPLVWEDKGVGAIFVARKEVESFSDHEIALLKTFSDQAVIAIENTRLFQELQSRTQQLGKSVEQFRALAEVSRIVNSTLDLQQVLSTIVTRAVQLSATTGGAVYEYDEAAEQLQLRATYGLESEIVETMLAKTLPLGEGATGRAVKARAPVEIADMRETRFGEALQNVIDRAGIRSLLAIPLLREGRVLGALSVSRRVEGAFPAEVTDLLQIFASQSAVAIQNARLFREIERKSSELEVASRHKSQFLANMSHELRTPLNAILGYTELIVDGIYGEVPQKILDIQERVQRSGRHLLGLINDVLDLSKIEAGQLALALSDYSFNDVVQTVITSVESLAAEKGLHLSAEVPPGLPVGRGDERRITQVLLNLVGNAIKFTDRGSVTVRVTAANGSFTISVDDTGPGIPVLERDTIFEEFRQLDSSSTRAKGGTGLGLAIARRIVNLHRGRIWVDSNAGQGSTFSFSIPVKAAIHGVGA
ncbi:MAG TPA: ATP-binding protein [Burkholderiales bacterium]|nr:ATP-binding protein [Burkholderiales bacterium]